jgi:hypothetical protein
MITVKEFKDIVLSCPLNWTIRFMKWEHGSKEDFMKRNHYPMPNRVSVKIQHISTKLNDEGHNVCTYIFEDDFDDDFEMSPTEMINEIVNDLGDNDLLNFVLYTEDTLGHYNHIPLKVEVGDKGYSDRRMFIELEEI